MYVPKGKRIHLINDGESYLAKAPYQYVDYQEIPMFLGEDLSIKTSSQYAQPFQSMQEKAFDIGLAVQTAGAVVEQVTEGTSLEGLRSGARSLRQTTFQNQNSAFQIWKYSDPVSFSFTVKFFLGIADIYNARLEVYYPTLRLMEIVLPEVYNANQSSFGRLWSMKAPGPDMKDFLDQTTSSSGPSSSTGLGYSIYIGRTVRLPDIIIKDVESTFSHEVDTLGYPIHSTVRMTIETQRVGTTNMIRGMMGNPVENEIEDIAAVANQGNEVGNAAVNSWVRSLLGMGT